MRGGFVRDDATGALLVSGLATGPFAGASVRYSFSDLGDLTEHDYGAATLTQNADSVTLGGAGISAGVALSLPDGDSTLWDGGSFTFGCRVSPSELPAAGEWRFIAMHGGNTAENYWFGLRNEGGTMMLECKAVGLAMSDDGSGSTVQGGNRLQVPYTPALDTPVDLVWRISSGRVDVFVDGEKQAEHGVYTGTPTPSAGDASTIASYNSGGSFSYGFHGDIDEVAYFRSAPSDATIASWSVPFAPTDLAGLTLQLKADDGSAAGAIATWTDAAGSGRFFSAVDTAQPTVVDAQINGLPVVRFTTDDAMTSAINPSVLFTSSQGTIFYVLKLGSAASSAVASYENDGLLMDVGGNMGTFIKDNAGVPSALAFNWDGNEDVASQALAYGVPALIRHDHDNTNLRVSVDKAAAASTPSGAAVPSGGMQLGKSFSSGNFLEADIGEILVYNRLLSAAEIAQVEGYLARWGV